jgi:type II secretory pathway predicted ATPase ExeA
MYEQYYGLRELPFELTPNPKFLYLTPQYSEALSTLQYGLASAKGITLLLGDAGTGKTTLLHAALSSPLCRAVKAVYINNPALTRDEFVATLARRFDLGEAARTSKADLLESLEAVLIDRRARGQITALVVDEAQTLTDALLEEIRLLANIETTDEKLLPVVLAGQQELRERLNEPHLRQFKQRIALRCELASCGLSETAAYILDRIKTAQGEATSLFTRDAIILIHERSKGIPRIINTICDNALLTGFALRRRPVTRDIIAEISHDLDLGRLAPTTRRSVEPEIVELADVSDGVSPNDMAVLRSKTSGSVADTGVVEGDLATRLVS